MIRRTYPPAVDSCLYPRNTPINRGQSPLIKSNFDGYTFVTVHHHRAFRWCFLNLLCRYLRGASNRFLRRDYSPRDPRKDYRRIYAVPAAREIQRRMASTLASRRSFSSDFQSLVTSEIKQINVAFFDNNFFFFKKESQSRNTRQLFKESNFAEISFDQIKNPISHLRSNISQWKRKVSRFPYRGN